MTSLYDTTPSDWAIMAHLYTSLTHKTSHTTIATLLTRLNTLSPFSTATAIHDSGCGPGSILARLLETHGRSLPPSCALSASDFAPAMIAAINATKTAQVAADPTSPWTRVQTSVLDAMHLATIPDSSLSHLTAGWVYFMTPDPMACLRESHRVLSPDGVLGVTAWKNSDWLQLTKLAERVRPDRKLPDMPAEWTEAESLAQELQKAGFREVRAEEVGAEMRFETYEGLVELLLKMPHMVNHLKEFEEGERREVRELVLEGARELSAEPGVLRGTSLVAVGRCSG